MKKLSNDHKDHPNQSKNSHKLIIKCGILFWVYWKVNGNWDNNIHDQNGGKAIAEQILASEERKNPKEQGCESHSPRS